jgi:hypothetical protein
MEQRRVVQDAGDVDDCVTVLVGEIFQRPLSDILGLGTIVAARLQQHRHERARRRRITQSDVRFAGVALLTSVQRALRLRPSRLRAARPGLQARLGKAALHADGEVVVRTGAVPIGTDGMLMRICDKSFRSTLDHAFCERDEDLVEGRLVAVEDIGEQQRGLRVEVALPAKDAVASDERRADSQRIPFKESLTPSW